MDCTSNVPGDAGVSFTWNFGDGSTGSGASVSHIYGDPSPGLLGSCSGSKAGYISDSTEFPIRIDP